MQPPVRCLLCGDAIGVFEPLLVVGPRSGRTTSLAREPLLGSGDEIIMHRACGLQLGVADDGDLGDATGPAPES